MISIIGIALAALLLFLVLHAWVCALIFLFQTRRAPVTRANDQQLPKAAILMGLKGADPDLAEGLQRLIQQDYPDFEFHIVVDSRNDPAWPVVQQAIEATAADHVFVDVYRPSRDTGPVNCTNAKQVQILRGLDDSIDVVAMADGDLMAHPNWLRDLVSPLVNEENVGATFGNRWFMPEIGRWGSLVRYVWNSVAVVSMYFLNAPWGGCYAIRMSVVREMGLIDKWAKVLAFDASTPRDLKQSGLKLRFVPSLIMPNYEECRLSFCHNFFQRQLTWTRLYHPAWNVIAMYGIVAGLVPLLSLIWIPVSFLTGNPFTAWLVIGGLIFNWLVQWMLLYYLQSNMEPIMMESGKEKRWFNTTRGIKLLLVIPLTQLIQFSAMLAAMICRKVRWRGIQLEIHSPTDIRMVGSVDPEAIIAKNARESI